MSVLKRVRYIPASFYGPFVLTGGWRLKRDPDQYIVTGSFYNPQKREYYEVIDNQDNTVGRMVWKNFQHYKCRSSYPNIPQQHGTWMYLPSSSWCDYFPCPDSSVGYRAAANIGPIECPNWGTPSVLNEALFDTGQDWIPDVPDRAAFVTELSKKAMPEIRPNLSIVNSIYELKDFKRLPQQLLRMKKTFDRLKQFNLTKVLFSPKYARKRTAQSILGLTSDVLLQQQFNISPLISDVKAIFDSLKTVRRKIDKILNDEGRKLVVHRSVELDSSFRNQVTTSNLDTWWNTVNPGTLRPRKVGATKQERHVHYTKRSLHVTLEYTYHIPGLMRERAHLLGMLDALGIQANPAIIWNALPWSFVVDWVIGVSRWLNQFNESNLKPVTVIHNACWSQNIQRELKTFTIFNLPWGPGYKLASYVEESSYKRRVFNVGIEAALLGSGISPKEFMLASALALSRQRR